MRRSSLLALLVGFPLTVPLAAAELPTGPELPYHVVSDWAQLPAGRNFGEVSAVDVDRSDKVWVFNRGPRPVIEFDHSSKMPQAWPDVPVKTAGWRLGADGNVWTVKNAL